MNPNISSLGQGSTVAEKGQGLMEMVTVYGESARRFWMRGRFMSRSWTK